MSPIVLAELSRAVEGVERPSMTAIQRRLAGVCTAHGLRKPSRATIYNTLSKLDTHVYEMAEVPADVRQALYNLSPGHAVPGHQLAFYCFNYGSLAAVSYAAGLPWLDLYQASRLRGWRPRSRGLLLAVMRARGLG